MILVGLMAKAMMEPKQHPIGSLAIWNGENWIQWDDPNRPQLIFDEN